jgi:GNAT superfamily N-acetyltransferase
VTVVVRRLVSDDWDVLRAVRLAALADAPYAFVATLADEQVVQKATWCQRLVEHAWFVAIDGATAVGVASGGHLRAPAPEVRTLRAMWVDEAHRGHGVADRIVEAVAEWARADGASELTLWALDVATRAKAFYERVGFTVLAPRDDDLASSHPAMTRYSRPLSAGVGVQRGYAKDLEGQWNTLGVPRIERLDPSSWERLRSIRLRALADEPDAFGSVAASERDYDETAWRRLTGLGPWWLAVEDDGDVGMVAGGRRNPDDRTRWVYSMWVDERWRGRAVAGALLDVVVDWAHSEGASRLGLDVTDRVPRARGFYERYGFAATGVVVPLPRDPTIALAEMVLELPRDRG